MFAGIGGIELGLHRSGHETLLLNEFDASASAVLEARFPGVRLTRDVRDLRSLPPETTLLTAGFPCQDLSQAGRTKGIDGAKSGLIGEVFRLLARKRVGHVLLENVPFMLQLSKGRALDLIVSELERLGYAWAYRVVDSRSFGLPQRRRRVYLLASRLLDPRKVLFADDAGVPEPIDANLRACGFYWTEGIRGLGWAVDAVPTLKGGSTVGIPSPPAIVFPDGRIGKPALCDAERLQGFEANWTAPACRAGRASLRWKLVGNAVTVDAAKWIGERLARPGDIDAPSMPLHRPGASWPTAAYNVGKGRRRVEISEFPVANTWQSLASFLQYEPEPLSLRATEGFRSRTKRSSLRWPEGFIEKLDAYLDGLRSRAA
ncbi:MAG: DNA (cytosine-5-)-methyltransferase [Deltaproteobacteria bacterium]